MSDSATEHPQQPRPQLLRQLRAALAQCAPELPDDRPRRWGVALSGGGDSVALLMLLVELGAEVVVLHVDHGLRSESVDEARWVEGLAARLGLPCRLRRLDVRAAAAGANVAATARRLRIAALHQLAREGGVDAIVLGHTLDDQAETVLLQLLRGAHLLRGMAPRRGRLLRPLLGVRREALRAYLRERGEGWLEDPSNLDRSSRRIWLRDEVIPQLEARAPGVVERIGRLASAQQDVGSLLAAEVLRRFGALEAGEGVAVRQLQRQPIALQRAVLAQLLRDAGAEVDLGRIERARAQLASSAPTPWRASVGRGLGWSLTAGELRVAAEHPQRVAATAARRIARAEELPVGAPASLLEGGPLDLRSRQAGDWVRFAFGRRALNRVLIDAKVPREERDAPLLARGSEVLHVPGVLTSEGGVARLLRDEDEGWMQLALAEARRAAEAGELPVGAVVVRGGELLGAAHNQTRARLDPSAHAEVLALREAAAQVGDWRLSGATLYVTLEPCPMCFGALQSAHVARVVFGAENLREGALGGVASLHLEPWKRRLEVRGGVAAKAAGALLSSFFAARRGRVGW